MPIEISRKRLNSQFWPPPASATSSSRRPASAMPPTIARPIRAWLKPSRRGSTARVVIASVLASIVPSIVFASIEPSIQSLSSVDSQRGGGMARIDHHHRLPAVHRHPHRRLGPEAPDHRRDGAHGEIVHHAQDLVGGERPP